MVLICSERKIMLTGYWFVLKDKKILLAGG
jgi:hypothetical protein